jgi:hypothetical protein
VTRFGADIIHPLAVTTFGGRRIVPERKLFPASAQIIDLARARAGRVAARRPRRPVKSPRLILLTSVAIGLAGGLLLARLQNGTALTEYRNGVLLARGPLERALNEQLVAQTPATASIRATATYRAKGDVYCRTFLVSGAQPLSGLACRSGAQWRIASLLGNDSAQSLEGGRNISGTALTSAAEVQLRSHDWR